MFKQLMLKGIFLITYFNVISTNPIELCNINCVAEDKEPVCVFDVKSVCFMRFSSKCVMENVQCMFQKEFMTYDAEYCKLEGFQCSDKPWPQFQAPPVEEAQPFTYNENPQEDFEIVFKHDNDNEDKERDNNVLNNEVVLYANNDVNNENNFKKEVQYDHSSLGQGYGNGRIFDYYT